MADQVRAGIIGAGFIGAVHAHAVRAAGGLVARVAASTPERSAAAADRLGVLAPAGTAEELIDSDDVHVVHICTPNSLHAPLAHRTLAAGKPVVCEKPLATTLSDARSLAAAAGDSVATVPFVYRFYPAVREARARVAAGEAGRLHLLHGAYLQDWQAGGAAAGWRGEAGEGGAYRAFADIGVHWCDLVEFTTGHRIVRLLARTAGGGTVTTVLFSTDAGASGSMLVSQTAIGRHNALRFSLDGADVSYSFDQEYPETLLVGGLRRQPGAAPRVARRFRGGGAVLAASARPPAGLPGLLQRLRRRHLQRDLWVRPGWAAHVRRRGAGRRAGGRRDRLVRILDLGGGALMKLGFLTACLPNRSLPEIAAWAAANAFEALEVAAWPDLGARPFTATHLKIDGFGQREADEAKTLFVQHGLTLSSLAYYDNNLHPDPTERKAVNGHVAALIDAAALLECPTVGTFVGRHPGQTVAENLRAAEEVFAPLVDRAGEKGVKLIIENCVMEGWHPDGYPGNLAYSPELWEWMFSLGLYLNFDPSHLVWMGIDPVEAVRPYVDRIPHAQAKDVQLFPEKRNRYGWPGKAVVREDPWDVGWWRYRVPGLGQVDWRDLIDTLYEGGFDGVLSVEHEDPVWGGTEERIETGLRVAHRTLLPLVVA